MPLLILLQQKLVSPFWGMIKMSLLQMQYIKWKNGYVFKSIYAYIYGEEMATHSSILAWRIPGMEEPGGLLSMGLHRVGHDWRDLAAAACIYRYVCTYTCVCIYVCVYTCVRACVFMRACSVTQSCPTLQPYGLQPTRLEPTRLPSPWDFTGKNSGVGFYFLLQGIFLTQGSNLYPLCWQVGSLNHRGSPVLLGKHD